MEQIIISGIPKETFMEELRGTIREEVRKELQQEIRTNLKPDKQRPYYDVPGLSDFARISTSMIYKGTSEGTIPHIKRGGKLLFKHEDIVKWLESGRQTVDA